MRHITFTGHLKSKHSYGWNESETTRCVLASCVNLERQIYGEQISYYLFDKSGKDSMTFSITEEEFNRLLAILDPSFNKGEELKRF